MEGLIPFVYKAIVQYKNGRQGIMGTWLNESPSASYMRLPGDSGLFQTSEVQLFRSDCGFSNSTQPPSASKRSVSTGVQSPARHCNPDTGTLATPTTEEEPMSAKRTRRPPMWLKEYQY